MKNKIFALIVIAMAVFAFYPFFSGETEGFIEIQGEVYSQEDIQKNFNLESKFLFPENSDLTKLSYFSENVNEDGEIVDEEGFKDEQINMLFEIKEIYPFYQLLNENDLEYSHKLFENFILETKVQDPNAENYEEIEDWYLDNISSNFTIREWENREDSILLKLLLKEKEVDSFREVSQEEINEFYERNSQKANEIAKDLDFRIKDEELYLEFLKEKSVRNEQNIVGEGEVNFEMIEENFYEIEAIAEEGYEFKSWFGVVEGDENPKDLQIGSNQSIENLDIRAIFIKE